MPNKKDNNQPPKLRTAKQALAIELLAKGEMSREEIAEAVGVHYKTLSKWARDGEFMDAVIRASRKRLKTFLPEVYKSLASNAAIGSHHHIKILLDHLEKLEDQRASIASISFSFSNISPSVPEEEDEE
jgi:hypothetical protein